MRVLVVGQGGREHALVWALARSPEVDGLVAAPGNAGMDQLAECVPIPADDIEGIVGLVEREAVDLTVVGPEAPLVAGLADALTERGRLVFGPTKDGAAIEGSKAWAKGLCERHGIPTPRSRTFTALDEATTYLDELEPPYVVKADGLAAGKGVTIAPDRRTAVQALEDRLVRRAFGPAGERVLIEEHLVGREVSALALTDGETVVPLVLAQDFKRVGDGDAGANTGGMGAYSPVPFIDEELEKRITEDVLHRTVAALREEGIGYRGVLYAGLMITGDGPKLLEFNCRFGDPETQAVIPRLASDLAPVLLACAEGRLRDARLEWSPRACVTVVAASGGYPGAHETGFEITGLDAASTLEDVVVFHAGTTRQEGRVVTAGGRVVAVSAVGDGLDGARQRAYEACQVISFQGMHYRSDIAEEAAGG